MVVYLTALSLLIAVVLLLRLFFRNKISPRLKYALWLAVVVKLCLPFAELRWELPPSPPANEPARLGELPEPVDRPVSVFPIMVAPPEEADSLTERGSGEAEPIGYEIPAPEEAPALRSTNELPAEPAEDAPASPRLTRKTVLLSVWIGGSALTGGWLTAAALRFRRRLRTDRILMQRTGKICRIYRSPSAGEPCTAGWSVYLPPEAADCPSRELILRHELTHLRHLDPLWNAVRLAALTVYWWNPLIWAAAILSKRDGELACDDAVAASLDDGERLRYARTLLEAAARRRTLRFADSALLSDRLSCPPMKERILRLTVRRKNSLLCAVLAVTLCLSAVGCSFGRLPKTPELPSGGKIGQEAEKPAVIANDPVEYAASDEYVTPEKQALLTHVFLGSELEKSETYSYGCLVQQPDEKPDGYTFCGLRYETLKNEEGAEYLHRDYALIAVNDDGTIREEKSFTLDSDEYELIDAMMLNGMLYLLVSGYLPGSSTTEFFVIRLDPETGEIKSSSSLCPLMDSAAENQFCHANGICADADGNLYVYMEGAPFCEILVMNAGMQKLFSVPMTNNTQKLMRGRDGRVYYTILSSGSELFSAKVYPVDFGGRKTGNPVLNLSQLVRGVYACPDHDFCYSTDTALYTVDFQEDGSAKVDILIDYVNSSITTAQMCVEILDIRDSDTVLLKERSSITAGAVTELFRRTDDIDLSAIKVIEIAYSRNDQINDAFDEAVAKFNKTHADMRFIIRDYRIYATEDDPMNGERRLMMDLLTGIYRPDLVIGQPGNPLIQGVLSQKLYTDLSPYLDSDPTLKDDLLGCVKRTFSTEDGAMWGITKEYRLSTIFGRSDILNGMTGWNMTEFLDYVEKLPMGTVLLNGLCQTNFSEKLMGNSGWNTFLDWENHTASFDSPNFLRLLEYWKSLPKDERAADPEEAHPDYVSGKIILAEREWWDIGEFLRPAVTFETEAVTPIGKIAAEGSSGCLLTDMNCYVMTAWNEYPAETWEFLASVINVEPDPHGYNLLPATKSGLDKLGKSAKSMTYRIYYDGGRGESSGLADTKLDRPGAIAYYTDETHAALTEFLDHQAGAPLSNAVPEEISAIVNEEVSAYLAGAKSAEDCARIVQSRVSVWMNEHS